MKEEKAKELTERLFGEKEEPTSKKIKDWLVDLDKLRDTLWEKFLEHDPTIEELKEVRSNVKPLSEKAASELVKRDLSYKYLSKVLFKDLSWLSAGWTPELKEKCRKKLLEEKEEKLTSENLKDIIELTDYKETAELAMSIMEAQEGWTRELLCEVVKSNVTLGSVKCRLAEKLIPEDPTPEDVEGLQIVMDTFSVALSERGQSLADRAQEKLFTLDPDDRLPERLRDA